MQFYNTPYHRPPNISLGLCLCACVSVIYVCVVGGVHGHGVGVGGEYYAAMAPSGHLICMLLVVFMHIITKNMRSFIAIAFLWGVGQSRSRCLWS